METGETGSTRVRSWEETRVGQVGPCKSRRGARTEAFTWWLTAADGRVGEATLAAVGRKMGLGTGRRRCRGGMGGTVWSAWTPIL